MNHSPTAGSQVSMIKPKTLSSTIICPLQVDDLLLTTLTHYTSKYLQVVFIPGKGLSPWETYNTLPSMSSLISDVNISERIFHRHFSESTLPAQFITSRPVSVPPQHPRLTLAIF